jgi:DNA polymerase I
MPDKSSAAAPRSLQKGDHVFLVDGSSFVFRAYFQSMNQDRKYNYRSDGLPTGAIRLFCTKIYQFIREGAVSIRPTHLAIIFDKSEQSFRKELYPPYKANRSEPPEDLIPQFPLMREAVRAFGLKPIEQDRYEADDIIATYARQATEAGADALIISADKDLMQIIKPGIAFYDFESGARGGKSYRPERLVVHPADTRHWKVPADRIESVVTRWEGVQPEQIVDVQALAGDSTDNIPGAPGIGIKTAAQLILEYGNLDTLLKRAGEIKQPKRRETLTDPEVLEKIRISRQLVKLVDDVAVETPLEDSLLIDPESKSAVSFLKAMEFTTLTKRIAEALGADADAIEPDPRFPLKGAAAAASDGSSEPADALRSPTRPAPPPMARGNDAASLATERFIPQMLATARAKEAAGQKVDHAKYTLIDNLGALDAWIARAVDGGTVAVDLVTTSIDPMQAEIVGLALALAPGEAAYLPLGHRATQDLLAGGGLAPGQLSERAALMQLKPLLESPGVLKVGHDLKSDITVLARHGVDLKGFDDVMLMSYVLDAGRGGHALDELASRHLAHAAIAPAEVIGKGRDKATIESVDIARALPYAAEQADLALRLWRLLKPRLTAERMTTAYETLERPLPPVLGRMERAGIMIDRQILSRLSGDFAQTMARLEDEIAELAGERFNLGSPKQLGDILFGKMNLPGASKTPTGAWSTRANVLEELAEQGHVLPERILEWRQVSKLKSTYTDLLPSYVNPETGRVHTSYALAATTTGRLSSSEPNLQNIPIRREDGRKIRKAFVAPPGATLASADYSQIELRLLAEIADVPALRQAFRDGTDIHAMTASEMFGVPVQGMPAEVRRRAKAINFGIIYGISAFGLANQLGIGREEAGAYIKKYFERFPGIRDYMETTKAACRRDGYVTTLFGRKMHYPEIDAKNPSLRAFNERAAINARLQGTAADIIRRAMIRIDPALGAAKLSGRMLLQVHDELVFEVPKDEVAATLPVVRKVMEDAPMPALALHVPLQVDARAAGNWDEAH